MKIFKTTRSIAGDRLTTIDPKKIATNTGDGHTHPNLPLLNNLNIENNYLKVGNTPVETHLLSEEW